jgi:Ca2+-binding EF-hand superfamily protein
MPALADLILTTANQNSIVLAELLSDIETICYRHNFSKGDHTNGEKIALSEFLKVLNHLKCIPLGIRFDRLLQLLDPDNIDAINYQEFVELLRKEINR